MLDIYKLQNQYLSLKTRTRALKASKPTIPIQESEGYELTEKTSSEVSPNVGASEKVTAIKKEWRAWSLASIKDTSVPTVMPPLTLVGADKYSGYGPLTVHWGAGPVWTSPLITGVLGCVAASAKLAEEWDRQG
jgi:hypothetical protein